MIYIVHKSQMIIILFVYFTEIHPSVINILFKTADSFCTTRTYLILFFTTKAAFLFFFYKKKNFLNNIQLIYIKKSIGFLTAGKSGKQVPGPKCVLLLVKDTKSRKGAKESIGQVRSVVSFTCER